MTVQTNLDHLHDEIGELLGRRDHRDTSSRRQLVEVLTAAERPLTLPEILDHDGALARAAAAVDFVPLRHSLDLHGHCAECS